jgi:hypothetical protein
VLLIRRIGERRGVFGLECDALRDRHLLGAQIFLNVVSIIGYDFFDSVIEMNHG